MGVSYLLDTNALIWLGAHGRAPRPDLIAELNEPTSSLFVSAVSGFEVSLKHRLGKLPQVRDLVENWSARVAYLGAAELPLRGEHGVRAGALDWAHRDPFDRLLVAQAIVENLTLVSADEAVIRAPGVRVLPW